jgi:murein DD-endopeptidase MepM/ murein hydrolase activator NlpD
MILFALVLGLLLSGTSAVAQLECRDTVRRGDPMLVIIRAPEAVETVRIELSSPGYESIVQAFPLESSEIRWRYAALVGLPSTMASGTYTVRAYGESRDLSFRYSKDVEVQIRRFPFEDIPLNEELTDLLTRKDPKKDEEARKLYELLRVFRSSSQFQYGFFTLPVRENVRTAGFGDIRKYTFPDGASLDSVHNGIDFGLVTGTPVYSCAEGFIAFAGQRITTGNTVVIEHLPGVYSLYFHLDRISVEKGAMVKQEQQVGTVGSTGLSTAAHLHWEVRINGIAVNPDAFIREGIIDMERLLDVPLDEPKTTRKGGDSP